MQVGPIWVRRESEIARHVFPFKGVYRFWIITIRLLLYPDNCPKTIENNIIPIVWFVQEMTL